MPDPLLIEIENFCRSRANPIRAEHCQKYFKTGHGEYGYGDVFLGIEVPVLRKTALLFWTVPLSTSVRLLQSIYHEERMLALMIWIRQFERGTSDVRDSLVVAYLDNTSRINNWDLVDISAHKILGAYLLEHDSESGLLKKLAGSTILWERRIAMISTLRFIQVNRPEPAFLIADLLLNDPEDLMHKAVGWMLREIGKRDQASERAFLDSRYKNMPRTMLRYAIERFDEPLRQQYLKGMI
ncbi:DNA alkylation repair protein [bacterium]|nr:DNA alkylation repair protein [candidate division CSSED10-310 bacterium]